MRWTAPAVLISLAAPVAASDFVLGLPIDCTLGETCYIQQYMDRDPGPDARDYICGGLVYDGHKGTDFALPTHKAMENGVNVIASAPGTVTGLRDGVTDRVYSEVNANAVAGRECGNGVVLRHENGYETQYCHMKSGSVTVTQGQVVERGQVLGQVGMSGKAEFPHVHLSVRRNSREIDPFDPDMTEACGNGGRTLWQVAPPYQAGGLIYIGFAAGVPPYEAVQRGNAAHERIAPNARGLVLFGFAYGGVTGDVMELRITGPGGEVIDHRETLDRAQAQFYRAAGKRLTAERWPAGAYSGTVTLIRRGKQVDSRSIEMTIPE